MGVEAAGGDEEDLPLLRQRRSGLDQLRHRAELGAEVDGSEIQIAFNARYVLDALSVMEAEQVEFKFDGPLSPGLIKPPGSDDYLYVIMPVRVAM